MARRPGGRGGDGDSLAVPAPNARMKGVSGTIAVRRRAEGALREPETALQESERTIESLERPTTVVGWSLPAESRLADAYA